MEYGKYETLARYGYTGAARPQGDWQTSAALTRQQYDDWRTRYLPRVARLADLGENNSLMNAQLARVGGLATSSLRTAQMAQDNQMARYGVSRPDNPNSNTLGLRNALAIAYSAAIFLIPICISFDTAEKRRYATYLILNRRFSFGF